MPGVPVDVVYRRNNFLCTVRLGEDWRVRMADTLLENLNDWAKPDGVEVTY
ncbi:DNA polymerase III subunit alpha [Bordetella pertussis]|nr:DNA polymerase III subunit alpha [Bordetella pertussis]